MAENNLPSHESGPQGLMRRPSRSAAMTNFSTEVFDHEVVPASLGSIAPILRVATEIENERPRVAYLCTTLNPLPFPFLCGPFPSLLRRLPQSLSPWLIFAYAFCCVHCFLFSSILFFICCLKIVCIVFSIFFDRQKVAFMRSRKHIGWIRVPVGEVSDSSKHFSSRD